ncbi:MAG: hypothetical protein WC136_08170, partial [Sphaerochaeta sp.]
MKHKVNKILIILLALAIAVSTSSCVVTENLGFKSTGYNTSSFNFTVEDFFIAVLEDFSEFMPEDEDTSIMEASIQDF